MTATKVNPDLARPGKTWVVSVNCGACNKPQRQMRRFRFLHWEQEKLIATVQDTKTKDKFDICLEKDICGCTEYLDGEVNEIMSSSEAHALQPEDYCACS